MLEKKNEDLGSHLIDPVAFCLCKTCRLVKLFARRAYTRSNRSSCPIFCAFGTSRFLICFLRLAIHSRVDHWRPIGIPFYEIILEIQKARIWFFA